ncbi:helix-turn-helix domain-containing protein [Hylemonella gracilis]|jgi:DNA-binding transcriptional regulator YiaG|uniref:Helix-turn-helix domain-containing protein n=1 Tax=Hylemonella gracilis TaxID=80880 RepID=A0A4P6UKK0_9BURK|nr:helix-turn-helix domain-containing protein [Hylemonella gracilis]QBK04647.1 helix-turn-helix domain-containing protein [Hylemonella gracilis]
MANITSLLKSEITRLARKEIRSEVQSLKKAVAHYRSDIAKLKRELAAQEKKIVRLGKSKPSSVDEASNESPKLRFRAAGFATLRKKLGLSAADMGKILNVSLQTVYHWEKGTTKPRASQLERIAEVRKLGRRGAAERLAEIE